MTAAHVFRLLFTELVQPRRLLVWVVVITGISVLAANLTVIAPSVGEMDAYVQVSGGLVYKVLSLTAAIFSAAVVSQEVEQKTIVYLLSRPIPRWKILVSRLGAAISVTFLLSLVAALAVSFAVFGGQGLANPVLHRDILAIFIGAVAYSSLFLMVSLLINRSMPVNLLFAFGWENVVPNLPGDTGFVSIFGYLMGIAQHPSVGEAAGPLGFFSGQLDSTLMTTDLAWGVLVAIILVTLGFSVFLFSNFEYVPREDTD